MIFTEMLSGKDLSLYPGPRQDQAQHIPGAVTREGSAAAVLVSSEERHEVRLMTGWGQIPSTFCRNLGFDLIRLGNHWTVLIRHEPSFVLIKITGGNVENWRGQEKGQGDLQRRQSNGQGEK